MSRGRKKKEKAFIQPEVDVAETTEFFDEVEELVAEVVEIELPEVEKTIMFGVATTDIDNLKKGEKVAIMEDMGDVWRTEKGNVSKLYLILKRA